MSKFAYVLGGDEVIYPYSVQSDGNLTPLGKPVSCSGAVDIACSNASKFYRGGNYLFVVSEPPDLNEESYGKGSISVFHIGDDGYLTPNVEYYDNGVQNDPRYIVGFYIGADTYYIYIDNFIEADDQNPLTEQIPGFKFIPPNSMKPWNKKVAGLPDNVVGDVAALEVVPIPGESPSYHAQVLLALYKNTQANKTQIVAMDSNAFGLAYLGGGEIDGVSEGYTLAANPNFVYVVFDVQPTTNPGRPQVVGFKLEGAGQKFIPLGNVAKLDGAGTAAVLSPNGKYLFVGVTAEIANSQGKNVVVSYKIGADGSLSKCDQKPCGANGVEIVSLAIDPSGKYIYAMFQYEGILQVYEVNDEDGSLTLKSPIAVGNDPSNGLMETIIVEV
jgi:hypothetical protein